MNSLIYFRRIIHLVVRASINFLTNINLGYVFNLFCILWKIKKNVIVETNLIKMFQKVKVYVGFITSLRL